MKKFHYLLMVMLLAVVAVGVTACGDEDEPSVYDLVGTWQMSYDSGETLIQFTEYGDFNEVGISTINGKIDIYVDHGRYYVSGNQLTIVYDDDIDGSDTIECTYSIRGNEITFSSPGYSETYFRVSDSAIERYL